jgi:hypothetical protein
MFAAEAAPEQRLWNMLDEAHSCAASDPNRYPTNQGKRRTDLRPLLVSLWLGVAACSQKEPPASANADSPATAATIPHLLAEVGTVEQLVSRGQPQRVIVRGGVAYVADIDGLSVYAVDARGRIELTYHVPTPGKASDLALSGTSLYVADGLAGLAVFALDPAERPRLLRHESMPRPARRVVAAEHAVAVLEEEGFITLLRPGRPAAHLSLPGDPRDAAWVGPHLYVADAGDGLLRVELEPGPPRVAFRDRTFRSVTSLAAKGSLLLVGLRDKRVMLLDTSPPWPRVLFEVTLDHNPARLDVLGTQVVAAGGEQDPGAFATLLELAGPASLEVRARLPFTVLSAARADTSLLLAARGADGLASFRPDVASEVRASVSGLKLDRVTAGDELIVAWGEDATDGFVWRSAKATRATEIAGVAIREAVPCGVALCTLDPQGNLCQRPVVMTIGAAPGKPVCAHVSEIGSSLAWQPAAEILWLLDETGGLQGFALTEGIRRIAAVSRPAVALHEQPARLVVEAERAVALDPMLGLLHMFELGQAPRQRGSYLLQARPTAVALAGGVALVAEPSAGLQVVDVKDPDRPHELSWIPLEPGPRGVVVWHPNGPHGEHRVALAQGEGGVSLWSWDGRGALRLLSRSDTSGLASDVAYARGSLWVADGTGMARIELSEERR